MNSSFFAISLSGTSQQASAAQEAECTILTENGVCESSNKHDLTFDEQIDAVWRPLPLHNLEDIKLNTN